MKAMFEILEILAKYPEPTILGGVLIEELHRVAGEALRRAWCCLDFDKKRQDLVNLLESELLKKGYIREMPPREPDLLIPFQSVVREIDKDRIQAALLKEGIVFDRKE